MDTRTAAAPHAEVRTVVPTVATVSPSPMPTADFPGVLPIAPIPLEYASPLEASCGLVAQVDAGVQWLREHPSELVAAITSGESGELEALMERDGIPLGIARCVLDQQLRLLFRAHAVPRRHAA